jgi:hypothetical protein
MRAPRRSIAGMLGGRASRLAPGARAAIADARLTTACAKGDDYPHRAVHRERHHDDGDQGHYELLQRCHRA